MKFLSTIWNFLHGKKTYILALLAIIYGFVYGDNNAIITGLIAMGLRNGISNEIQGLGK